MVTIWSTISVTSVIPPVLVNNVFIVEAEEKCHIFNEFFRKQCIVPSTSSQLPPLNKTTLFSIKEVNFTPDDITKHIKKLNSNKSHGHDNIPIRIIKIFGHSISNPLFKIYSNCIKSGYFPKEWKKGNIIPVYKKNEKNLIKNYRPISLLPICGKIFEKLIFDNLYNYIFSNNFISDKQSGYRRGDSTVKQLLSITHEIYKAFDQGNEIRAVFLDISKAFDTVWHSGLLHKLQNIGVEGDMIKIIKSFLSDRQQRVTIDGKNSDWEDVQAGVPQGSLLGPLLFLVYINDLVDIVESEIRIFADDTFIFTVVNENCTETLNRDLRKITDWAWQWKMVFNPDITKQAVEITFSNKHDPTQHDDLIFGEIPVKKVRETKHLGMILDAKLSFVSHIENKLTKAKQELGIMKQVKRIVTPYTLEQYYKMWVRPHLEYGDLVFDKADQARIDSGLIFSDKRSNETNSSHIESIQYQAARIVTGAWKSSDINETYKILGWESLESRRTLRKLILLYNILTTKSPPHLYNLVAPFKFRAGSRQAEAKNLVNIPCRINFKKTFLPSAIIDWNRLPETIKKAKSKNIFQSKLLKMNNCRPKKKPYFGINDHNKVRNLTALRLGLSPLNAHKHKRGFADTPDPFCRVCGSYEDTQHFLLLCKSYRNLRTNLLNKVSSLLEINLTGASTIPRSGLVKILLYGKEDATPSLNKEILEEVSTFISLTKRFEKRKTPTEPV